MSPQGAEESYLTVMLAKFIVHIDLVLKFKTTNVTEQSMLSSYASGEILSTKQKADKGRNQNHVTRSMWTVTYW